LAGHKAAFIYSQAFEGYAYPEAHPFHTERARQVRRTVESMGLLGGPDRVCVPPVAADRRMLKKFHTARYLKALKTASDGKWNLDALHMGIGTPDCPIFKGMYEYASLATGATLVGADLILKGDIQYAFNPSGGYHHAGPEKAAGFCYINDVALGCLVLAEAGKRVLYLDIDVHNGDGVAEFFYERSDVMTISLHEDPALLFPGTGFVDEIGRGEGLGYCVNVPLPVGTYDEAYLKAFRETAVPLIRWYKPDVIVFELGADALAGDPLAHLQLTNNVYADIVHWLMELGLPILMTGGGGYHVENTVRAWTLAWSVLCGADSFIDMAAAMGGVMLESLDWQAGLRDRALAVTKQQRDAVEPAIEQTVRSIRETVFPLHGL